MAKPLRVAVIGLGQGQEHVDACLGTKRVKLLAVCDQDPKILKEVAARLPPSTLKCLKMDEIPPGAVEAIIVALPHHRHAKAIQWAAKRGLHVLKEKPLARTLKEAHEIANLMRSKGFVLHTGVQRHCHPTYERLRAELQGKKILAGAMELIVRGKPTAGWRSKPAKSGGGVLIDLGYHGIDLFHYLLGPLQPLACTTSTSGDAPCPTSKVESEASVWALAGTTWIHMRFGLGEEKRERLEIELSDGRTLLCTRNELCWRGSPEPVATADENWDATLVRQVEKFAEAVRSGETSTNDLAEQTPTLRFIERCYAMRPAEGLVGRGSCR